MIRVIVNGCNGKMGKEVISALAKDTFFSIVGKAGSNDDLKAMILTVKPDVVIDFTNPNVAFDNAQIILSSGCNAVIGTTGITLGQRDILNEIALKNDVGILIAPNFSIGVLLMMKFAAEAAKYLPNVEIIEYHHDQKQDAPSGTAITTAEYINRINGETNPPAVKSQEVLDGISQGAQIGNIRIHAIRLPGLVASQEVLLGEKSQTLKIRHDTINRDAYMPGITFSLKTIVNKKGLFYGLETLLFQ